MALPPLDHSNKKRNQRLVGQAALRQGKLCQGRAVIERSTIMEQPAREMDFARVGLQARCRVESFFSHINVGRAAIVQPMHIQISIRELTKGGDKLGITTNGLL